MNKFMGYDLSHRKFCKNSIRGYADRKSFSRIRAIWSQEEQRTVLGLLKSKKEKKEKKKKDLGIRNYPESCMEKMLEDDQVHGI